MLSMAFGVIWVSRNGRPSKRRSVLAIVFCALFTCIVAEMDTFLFSLLTDGATAQHIVEKQARIVQLSSCEKHAIRG